MDQLSAKAGVKRATHERVQPCQDPQTEFALQRESQGVSRINHILRVHGHTILQEIRAAEMRNRVQKSARHRGFSTLESPHSNQASLQAVIHDAVLAGLLPKQPLETRFAAVIETDY